MAATQETDLFAIVRYDDAPKAMDWLERAFGFERELVVTGDDGSIAFAEMRLGDDYIGTGATRPELRHAVAFYVDDMHAYFERAKAAGAEVVEEPKYEDYGGACVLRDPWGHTWSFGNIRPDKPAGCDIFPIVGYPDEEAAIDFLKRAFGFEERFLVRGEDGKLAHAELALGYGIVMPTTSQGGGDNPWANVDFGLYVCLEDVDAHYAGAKQAGAEIVREPADQDYGARDYSVRDIEGRLWSFGTYRPEGSRP